MGSEREQCSRKRRVRINTASWPPLTRGWQVGGGIAGGRFHRSVGRRHRWGTKRKKVSSEARNQDSTLCVDCRAGVGRAVC